MGNEEFLLILLNLISFIICFDVAAISCMKMTCDLDVKLFEKELFIN